ncbi:hypothetical protein BLOT_008996 [Blomia tropicalis]|nr:hypothetical protein BLOT_008996 [Blomia tropicalis]
MVSDFFMRNNSRITYAVSRQYRGKTIEDYFRNIAVAIINIPQPFLVIMDLFMLFYTVVVFNKSHLFLKYFYSDPLWTIGMFAIQTFHVVINDYTWILFVQLQFALGAFSISTLTFIYIRAEQNLEILKSMDKRNMSKKQQHQCEININRFISNDLVTFKLLFILDRSYSQLCFVYMLSNMPINAYLLTLSLLGKMDGLSAFFIGCFVAQQILGIGIKTKYSKIIFQAALI